MYSDWVWLLPAAVFVWLVVLTFLIWQQRFFFENLFPKSGERDIRKKFEEVLKLVSNFKTDLSKLEDKLSKLEHQGWYHVQRMELLRYNPYEDTGGDQSFTVALLDNKGTGFVLTSLHARSGTRIFAKPVVEGKSSQYELSKEEKLVIKKALED